MKYIIVFSLFIFVTACSSEFEHEDELCDCYTTSLLKQDEDFDSVLYRLENKFIATGELASNSGEDYYESLYKISQSGIPSIDSFDVDIFADLLRMEDVKFDTACVSIRFNNERASKLTRVNMAIDSLAENNIATFQSLLQTHMVTVTSEGYNHPLYKSDYYYFYGIAMDNFLNQSEMPLNTP